MAKYRSNWEKIDKGRHAGKTSPQVVILDPDYFFFTYTNSSFWSDFGPEIQELYLPGRNIKIPQEYGEGAILRCIKIMLFDDTRYYMTRKRCERFFENDKYFVLDENIRIERESRPFLKPTS